MTPEEAKALREHLKLNLYDFVKLYMNEPFPKVDDYGDPVNYKNSETEAQIYARNCEGDPVEINYTSKGTVEYIFRDGSRYIIVDGKEAKEARKGFYDFGFEYIKGGFQPGGEQRARGWDHTGPLKDRYAEPIFDFKYKPKKTYKDENGKEIKIDIDLDTFRKIPGFPTMPSRRYAALMRAFPITEATIVL